MQRMKVIWSLLKNNLNELRQRLDCQVNQNQPVWDNELLSVFTYVVGISKQKVSSSSVTCNLSASSSSTMVP